MRFGGYSDEERVYRGCVMPSDSYTDLIAEDVGATAFLTGICGGVYYLFRDRANTAFKTRLVNSLTKTPRLAAMVAGCSLISTSVDCSLVALRGEGDKFNAFVDSSLFFGLLARSRTGPAFASIAGLLGGAAMNRLNKVGQDMGYIPN